jgi:hypothetical protein
MCDYSLQSVSSRPAKVGDKLTTRDFGTGTRGFCASEDANVAVCILPGTELSFADEIVCKSTGLFPWRPFCCVARVSLWPVADVALCPRFGRYQRKSGHDVEPREATRRYSVPLGLGGEERRAGLRMISRYRQ